MKHKFTHKISLTANCLSFDSNEGLKLSLSSDLSWWGKVCNFLVTICRFFACYYSLRADTSDPQIRKHILPCCKRRGWGGTEGLCVSVSHGLLNCDAIGMCCAWGDGGFTAGKKDGGRKAAADGGHSIGPGSIDTGNDDPIFASKLSCMSFLSLNPVKSWAINVSLQNNKVIKLIKEVYSWILIIHDIFWKSTNKNKKYIL